MKCRRASGAILATALFAGPLLGAPGPSRGAPEADPEQTLRRAFERRYGCDTHQTMTLQLRSRGREVQRQRIEVVTKMVDARLRALARFIEPPDLRDTALLVLEQADRADEYFLFLPAIGRVRRVSGAQRSDSFMGTDLAYEDLERRRVEDFQGFRLREGALAGEPVSTVSARPRAVVTYDRAEFVVAHRDHALLETRYFAQGAAQPFKVIRFPRERLRADDGVLLPTLILVENLRKRTETEVNVDELRINPEIDDRLFTTDWLQRDKALDPD